MIITRITVEKSKTIKVAGMLGREAYNKLSIGMTAEYTKHDYRDDGTEEVRGTHYRNLSALVDEQMNYEIKKIKDKINK